jgi:diadenosine tetraphosphatase ApaH/serine/threonine PP2A family protein phosphatase
MVAKYSAESGRGPECGMTFAGDRVETIDEPVRRLACLADVHANIAALEAVFASEQFRTADAVAFLGCTTLGPEPFAVLDECAKLSVPTYFLSGNGERAVVELSDGTRIDDEWVAGAWLVDCHGQRGVELIRRWPVGLIFEVEGLGSVRLCHGSPRSDIELFTPQTPPARIAEATAGVDEPVVVHGHTHLQYERTVNGKRIVGSGSVGLPYTSGAFGARWSLLGPDVELICTPYDIESARARIAATDYPSSKFLQTLEHPPNPEEIIADCEVKCFSD